MTLNDEEATQGNLAKRGGPVNRAAIVGRFAPSPTGPLHFGSLVAAAASFLDAKSRGGRWLLRIEDIDPPREMPGATAMILRALEAYGLHWDGEILYQSGRIAAYHEALASLRRDGFVYPCNCSRKDVAVQAAALGLEAGIYPGTCGGKKAAPAKHAAWRVRTAGAVVFFHDRLQGAQKSRLEEEAGDFVVRRADGRFAYQLACVVDDAFQGISDVVRGADLLDSTPRQIHLQRLLALPTPGYLHLPVAVDRAGDKLSKQTRAPALPLDFPLSLLCRVMEFLGQPPPPGLTAGSLEDFWRWALADWRPQALPQARSLPAPALILPGT